ncbi:hypothetical protein EW146_g5694 [Bondarzewia mesenterica]|uniref:Cyclase n=1 Tax=Bondarzewia mesenterica TaxID=1095465 RepID=A0A4S4LWF0_9AGAM|nr:hypothetical protein EW146_g5694 [Bondarzewia mesenterica]
MDGTRALIDLTHPLDETIPVYPGDPSFSSNPLPVEGYSVHALSLSSHAGTHVDAPSHFFPNLSTIDQIPLHCFVRPALVLDLTHKKARERITWDDLKMHEGSMSEGITVLVMTGWSRFWGRDEYFDHPWIEREAAEKMVERGVKLVGTDTMSPDQSPCVFKCTNSDTSTVEDSGFGVHEVVLGAGCIIAENLTNLEALKDLQDLTGSKLIVSLMPLKIAGCDGSPMGLSMRIGHVEVSAYDDALNEIRMSYRAIPNKIASRLAMASQPIQSPAAHSDVNFTVVARYVAHLSM